MIPAVTERRRKSRFEFRSNLRYRLVERKLSIAGKGNTLNVSSGGILFTTEQELPVGRTVAVEIDWPALLDGCCLLKLVGTGMVLRSNEHAAAIRILKYEFHTRRAQA